MFSKSIIIAALLGSLSACESEVALDAQTSRIEQAGRSNQPVTLVRAHSQRYATWGGGDLFRTDYLVEVQNIAYEKQVTIVTNSTGTWHELEASYVGPSTAGNELWRAEEEFWQSPEEIEVAVRYIVDGKTYWDNGGETGVNHRLERDGGSLLIGKDVLLYRLRSCGDGNADGIVEVRNIDFEKVVKIYYTDDHWNTTNVVQAFYYEGPNAQGIEQWRFEIKGIDDANLELAISYSVAGQTIWDNSYGAGRNYQMVPANPVGIWALTCSSKLSGNAAALGNACAH